LGIYVSINYHQLLCLIIAKYAEVFDCVFTAAVRRNTCRRWGCGQTLAAICCWPEWRS